MTNTTQGLLAETTELWNEKGWDLDGLNSFRMEFVPGSEGSDNGTGESQQQPTNDNSGQGSGTPQPQSNPFLNEVDEAHRPIVEPYLKKWDANVTQRFQELHSKYRPYEELGANPEELESAYGIFQALNNDPKAFLQMLQEALSDDDGEQGPGSNNGNNQLPFQGLPEDFQTDYQRTQQAVEAMAQMLLDQQEAAQRQSEDTELDNYLSSLKKTHGEFDEEYVLAKMYATGCDGEQAIAAWKQSLQEFVNRNGGVRQPSGFKALSGGGSAVTDSQKVTDLSRKDTKNLVASIMEAAQTQ